MWKGLAVSENDTKISGMDEYDEVYKVELPDIEPTRLQAVLWKTKIAHTWLRLRILTIKLRRRLSMA